MPPEFHETMMGNRFYQGTMPKIADALAEIVKELQRLNENLEKLDISTEVIIDDV